MSDARARACGIKTTSARGFVHTAQLVRGPLSVRALASCALPQRQMPFSEGAKWATHRSSVGRGRAEAARRYIAEVILYYYYILYYNIAAVSRVAVAGCVQFRCAAATILWRRRQGAPRPTRAVQYFIPPRPDRPVRRIRCSARAARRSHGI